MTLIQKLAIFYALMFFAVVGICFVPALMDDRGYTFGLFSLQWYDHLLHAFSGVWAGIAAFVSHRQSVFRPLTDIDLPTRFFANAPHLAIGGFAVFVGFWLSKRVAASFAPA